MCKLCKGDYIPLEKLKEKIKKEGITEHDCFDCGDTFPLDELGYAKYEDRLVCENCREASR